MLPRVRTPLPSLAALTGLVLLAVAGLAPGLAAGAAAGAPAGPVQKNGHVEVSLESETGSVAPGSTAYLAIREAIQPHWHTYWRNPGDSGEPTTVKWTLPAGWKAGEIVWPAPHRQSTGPLVNYVFDDTVVLPVPVEIPGDARPGSTAAIKAHVDYLVCADVCVPESADLALDLPVTAGSPAPDPAHGRAIADALAAAPKAAGLEARWSRAADGALKLAVVGAPLKGADVGNAWFYPYDGALIDHAGPELVARGPDGLTLTLTPGPALSRSSAPASVAGVLVLGPGRAWEVTATQGPAPAGAAGLSPPTASGRAGAGGGSGSGSGAGAASGGGGAGLGVLLLYAGAAFLGGLILNLMPCVFPVLSIKAAQLVRHGGEPAKARAEGLAFLVGVVATFLALAAALLLARAGGQAVGWGFQLQDPAVTAAVVLIMLAAALNLSGVFEVGLSVQGAGAGLTARGGLAGPFFTGALAVVVAAPCSAPFMAGAVGWAVTQPPAAALLVFAFLGLGLAAPFTLLAFTPALTRRLPRPGAWMETVKQVLAFPMYGAAAYFAWVFAAQTGPTGLPLLFAGALALAFAAWLWGAAQSRQAQGRGTLPVRAGAVLATVAACAVVLAGARDASPAQAATVGSTAGAAGVAGGGLTAEPWSPARVEALRAEGRPVFVDFTAAWCVTCQVNERTALAGRGVADAFARHNAVYLKADWTRRDATIAQALTEHGRSGVPLYLVYGREGAPAVLPQLLTEGAVVQALDAASARPAG